MSMKIMLRIPILNPNHLFGVASIEVTAEVERKGGR